MATTAERVGRGPCPNCGESVTFKRSAGKLLNFRCDACCSTGYAEPAGPCHDKWLPTIRPMAAAPPGAKSAADPAPDNTPPPAPKPRAAFSLDQL